MDGEPLVSGALTAISAHPFPLIRGGGLFLMGIGAGFLLGWIFPRIWVALAIAGGVLGIVGSGLSALLPSLGPTAWWQITALGGAIVIEMGLIAIVVNRYKEAGDRTLILAILFVVGAHFLIMGAAHGPLIFLLGLLNMLNAAVALRLPAIPLRLAGFVDAALKLGVGAWMFLGYPAFTFFG